MLLGFFLNHFALLISYITDELVKLLSNQVWSSYCKRVSFYAKFSLDRFLLEYSFDFTSRLTFSRPTL